MSTDTFNPELTRITPQCGRTIALAAAETAISRPLIGTAAFHELVTTRWAEIMQAAVSSAARRRYQRLARGVEHMINSPFATHTIDGLAAVAGMSRSSFAHCFSAVFERGPLDFLKVERLRVAAHLLCTTSLPVKAIAGQVGYGSVSFFSRSFYAAYGMSPSAARSLAATGPAAATTLPDDGPAANANRHGEASALSHEDLLLVCRAAHDVTWDIDLTTGQVRWSESMLGVFGYGRDQVGPDTTWCQEHIHPDDRARVVDGMQRACADGDVLWRDAFRYRRADGSYAHVADRGVIMRDASGRAVRFTGVMLDISVDAPLGDPT